MKYTQKIDEVVLDTIDMFSIMIFAIEVLIFFQLIEFSIS